MAYIITCKRCGYTDAEDFFPRYSRTNIRNRRPVCLMCVQEEKDTAKRPDRVAPKARSILFSHCEKYNRRNGTALKPTEFARKFGWDLKKMAHDIQHAFDNWCSYCESPYSAMSHGLADVTLDIINPKDPPYYTNVRFCCATCNRRKGEMGATAFGKFLAFAKRRREFIKAGDGTPLKPQYTFGLKLDGTN